MYECVNCKSKNCEELRDYPMPVTYKEGYVGTQYSYNDNLVEVLCHDCGVVTKINPSIYERTHLEKNE